MLSTQFKPVLPFLFGLFICSHLMGQNGGATKTLSVQEGQVIRVRLLEAIDSKYASAGDILNFETTERLEIDGATVIENNARVTGSILRATKNKSLGKKGQLDISIDYVQATNGINIPLKFTSSQEGKGSSAGVIAGAVLVSPVALFIKGKSARIEKGTEFNTYVARTTAISLE